MQYIDYEYIKSRLGEKNLLTLTQSDSLSGVDIDFINTCCSDASSVIDTYVGQLVEPISDIIRHIAFSIARYYLITYNRASTFIIEKDRKDPVITDYENAISLLEKMPRSANSIPTNTNSLSNLIKFSKNRKMFTDKSLSSL